MKRVSLNSQDKITAIDIPQPNTIVYNDITIEINPVLTLQQKKEFCDGVWAFYWSADTSGYYDFRPYTRDFAIRMMTIKLYTNLKIEYETAQSRNYEFIAYSGVYEAITAMLPSMDYVNLMESVEAYIKLKCAEIHELRIAATKDNIDLLLEDVLSKANDVLDFIKADQEKSGNSYSVADLIKAAGQVVSASDEGSLVNGILDWEEQKKARGKNGATGKKITRVPKKQS